MQVRSRAVTDEMLDRMVCAGHDQRVRRRGDRRGGTCRPSWRWTPSELGLVRRGGRRLEGEGSRRAAGARSRSARRPERAAEEAATAGSVSLEGGGAAGGDGRSPWMRTSSRGLRQSSVAVVRSTPLSDGGARDRSSRIEQRPLKSATPEPTATDAALESVDGRVGAGCTADP